MSDKVSLSKKAIRSIKNAERVALRAVEAADRVSFRLLLYVWHFDTSFITSRVSTRGVTVMEEEHFRDSQN